MSYISTLNSLKDSGNYRQIPAFSKDNDTNVVDLSSNDYLGIAAREDLKNEFLDIYRHRLPAMTSSASRLLASDQEEYHTLESCLSILYGGRHCLLFNSGYHANTGLISALASEPGSLIVADKLVHASMIDGIILSRAPFKRFPHNDFNRLESIIAKEAANHERIIIAVESIYSMDGDHADIDALIALKKCYPNVLLYVDEAHAFGAYGEKGLGVCQDHPDRGMIDVVVGTFGKAAASMGAFCITSEEIHDYAVNHSRSLIFSTALPPFNCAWTRFIINKMTEMDAERQHLKSLAELLHNGIAEFAPQSAMPDASHITPYIVGDARQTVALSMRLLERGFKVLPIRTPTVSSGTERLRISLSASLSEEVITDFIGALSEMV